MSAAKHTKGHTKGPWHLFAYGGDGSFEVYDARKMFVIAARNGAWDLADVMASDADARLIAAAPDMHEALRDFALLADELSDTIPDDKPLWSFGGGPIITAGNLRAARAALKKAEG